MKTIHNFLTSLNASPENGNLLLISESILPIIIPCCAAFAAGRIFRELQDEFTFEKYLLLSRWGAVSAFARCLYDICRDLLGEKVCIFDGLDNLEEYIKNY